MQVFFCFALITNLIVSALLVLGGSAVINAVTGMNVYAASMLIPISVLLYTASGGLKATFTTSYAHTVIIYVALCLFTFTVYAGSKDLGLGSIDRVCASLHPRCHVLASLQQGGMRAQPARTGQHIGGRHSLCHATKPCVLLEAFVMHFPCEGCMTGKVESRSTPCQVPRVVDACRCGTTSMSWRSDGPLRAT